MASCEFNCLQLLYCHLPVCCKFCDACIGSYSNKGFFNFEGAYTQGPQLVQMCLFLDSAVVQWGQLDHDDGHIHLSLHSWSETDKFSYYTFQ